MLPLKVTISVIRADQSDKYNLSYHVLEQDTSITGSGKIYETNNLAIISYEGPYLYLKFNEPWWWRAERDNNEFVMYIKGTGPRCYSIHENLLKSDVLYILDNVWKLVTEYNKIIGKSCEPEFVFGEGVIL